MKSIIKVIYLDTKDIKIINFISIKDEKLFNELIKYKCPVRFDKLLHANEDSFEYLKDYIQNNSDDVTILNFTNRTVKYSDMEVYTSVVCEKDYDKPKLCNRKS